MLRIVMLLSVLILKCNANQIDLSYDDFCKDHGSRVSQIKSSYEGQGWYVDSSTSSKIKMKKEGTFTLINWIYNVPELLSKNETYFLAQIESRVYDPKDPSNKGRLWKLVLGSMNGHIECDVSIIGNDQNGADVLVTSIPPETHEFVTTALQETIKGLGSKSALSISFGSA